MNDQATTEAKPEAEAEAARPTAQNADGSVTVRLSKPTIAHGETVASLTFQEPTGADIDGAGVPCTLDFAFDPPRFVFNAPEMSSMMARLAQVPPSTIAKLPSVDWVNCAWRLSRFFVPGLTTLY